ncbi:MAG: flagellar hook capping protein [Aquabacterium sp.]|jgi:flagellar basal-body rod modification protein FlgD|nr:MAG: flagellar hook capping protein [Aquabacterium sp.]
MAVESIGQSLASGTPNVTLSQEDFIRILTTQLSYQDPLKPLDNQQFMAQMAQFSALEQNRQINDNLVGLLEIQSATQSIGLIGRTVEVANAGTGGTAVGTVTTLRFSDGTPLVTVKTADGQVLPDLGLSAISVIR